MTREIIYSTILHVVVVSMVLFSAPFSIKKQGLDFEVIKVNAISAAEIDQMLAPPMEPPSIPEAAIEEESFDIPIEDPTTVDEPAKIDKPKPKPKPKPKEEKPKNQVKPKTETQEPSGESEPNGNEIDTKETGAGSPFAGATVDNASFNYPYWFTQAFNKISQNFRKTVSLDGNVVCVVYFEVIRSGRVISAEIKQPSGISAVDRDCLAAIERSSPFPPLPQQFRDEIIGITVPIKY